jgi:DNA primase
MVRSLGMFYSYDIYPQVLILPDGIKDIDEWQKKEADSDQVMTIDRFLTYTKEGFGAFVHTLTHNHDIHNPIQRKLIIGQIFDLLKHVADYSVVMLYITQIADTLQIDQTLLFNQYKTHLKGQTFKTLPSHSA